MSGLDMGASPAGVLVVATDAGRLGYREAAARVICFASSAAVETATRLLRQWCAHVGYHVFEQLSQES